MAQQLAAEQKVAATFQDFAPSAGIAKLPPLPQLATGQGSSVPGEPTDPGTYSPTLNYPQQTVTERYATRTAAGEVYHTVSAALNNGQLIDSLAAALVVILLAGHLRAFARRGGREQ